MLLVNNMPDKSYFQKILVAVDGSSTSLLAEELAVIFAKKFQSKLTVVHTVPEELLHRGVQIPLDIPKSVFTEISEWFVKKGEEREKNHYEN